MKRTFGSIVVVVGLFLGLTACTATPPTGDMSPAPFNYSGSWSGNIQDSMAGPGTLSATLTQSGTDLGGTWQSTFAAGTNGGSAIGVINGSEVIVELHPASALACPYRVVATRSGRTLQGNYASFNCIDSITGTVTITKQ